jgi:hypothetical protein
MTTTSTPTPPRLTLALKASLAILVALAIGCDPGSCAVLPSGECVPTKEWQAHVNDELAKAELRRRHPIVVALQTETLTWSVRCGTPAAEAAAFREAVVFWNTAIRGILAPESPCGTGTIDMAYLPNASIDSGVGGPGFVHIVKPLPGEWLLAVALHELGHATGWTHATAKGCVMFGKPEVPALQLCEEELAAIAALYPQGVQ